jgi:arsenate reductase
MMTIHIYHNPRCSKSRRTLEILREQGQDPEVIEYLSAPPTTDALDEICTQLDVEPLAIIRTNESRFTELGLSKEDDRSRAAWIELMVANPVLIERPIVVNGNQAVIGRPPESVLDIL